MRRLARRRLGAHAVPAAGPDMTLHRVSYDDETAYAYAYFDGDRPGNQDKVADCWVRNKKPIQLRNGFHVWAIASSASTS